MRFDQFRSPREACRLLIEVTLDQSPYDKTALASRISAKKTIENGLVNQDRRPSERHAKFHFSQN
jgi:hypothetical protein